MSRRCTLKNFDGLVFRCIDETLAGVMGLVARDTIYLDLLTNFSITRDDLPRHLDSLMAVFESRFGQSPTKALSRAIARRLYSELQMEFASSRELDLSEYVSEVRAILLDKSAPVGHTEPDQINLRHVDANATATEEDAGA